MKRFIIDEYVRRLVERQESKITIEYLTNKEVE
jgi:low affinity Fe/Cu permease